jgi:DNA-binding response OmpR family regulator
MRAIDISASYRPLSTDPDEEAFLLDQVLVTDLRPSLQSPPRVLVAEDDREMRALLTWSLREAGYFVHEVADGMGLCRDLVPQLIDEQDEPFDLVISDVRMPGIDGLEVLRGLRYFPNRPPIIIITAFGDDALHQEAEKLGARVVDKPFDFDELIETVLSIVPVD